MQATGQGRRPRAHRPPACGPWPVARGLPSARGSRPVERVTGFLVAQWRTAFTDTAKWRPRRLLKGRGVVITSRTGQAGFLVLGTTAALFALALGLINVGVDRSDVNTYLNLAWLTGLTISIAAIAAYLISVRQARASGRLTTFDQQLQLRNFAIRSIPSGAASVAIALVWYIGAGLGNSWGGKNDSSGFIVNVFAGLGAVFVVLMFFLAVSFEKRAIRAAAEDIAGVAS